MDDLANLVQDVRYEGELLDPRPKPVKQLKPLTMDQIMNKIDKLKSGTQMETEAEVKTGLAPLDFEALMREYLGYHMIKSYLKSLNNGSHIKLDFIEQVDIFQICTSQEQRRIVGNEIWKTFCAPAAKSAAGSPVVTDSNLTTVGRVSIDPTTGQQRKYAKSWRPKPQRIHVDSMKLQNSLPFYEKYGKDGDNLIGVSGAPIINVSTLFEVPELSHELKSSAFGDLKYIVLASIYREHYQNFLDSEFLYKYINWKQIEDRDFTDSDFNNFRVLGRGGFGLVSGGKNSYTGKLYAIKALDKARVKNRKAEDLCWAERRALGKVRSPFVLNLKYAFQTADTLYLVLDLMTGGDLAFHLRKQKKFDENIVRFFAASVLEGLAHLHSKNIVYRDLKPANVLLDEFGNAILTDLGLAETLSTRTEPPSTKGKCGTRGYWAPEMLSKDADGKSCRYGISVDWWSFGVFIYELLKGKGPFRGANALDLHPDPDVAIDRATLTLEVDYPEGIFSPEAKDLLQKLLERDPNKRLGTKNAQEVREHPFFSKIDFGLLELGRVEPPWNPNPNDINALSQDEIGLFEEAKLKLTAEEQEGWSKWDFKSKSVIQFEVTELLMWEEMCGPTKLEPPPGGNPGCCSIL